MNRVVSLSGLKPEGDTREGIMMSGEVGEERRRGVERLEVREIGADVAVI